MTRKTQSQKSKRPKNFQDVLENDQLKSITQVLTTIAAGLIVIIGLRYIASDIIAPILMSLFLSVLLTPVFHFFRKRGYSRTLSVILMIFSLIVIAGGAIWILSWSFSVLRETLDAYIGNFNESLTQLASQVGVNTETTEQTTSLITPELVLGIISTILSSLGNLFVIFVIIPILAILILIQIDSMPKGVTNELVKNYPAFKSLDKVAKSIMVYIVGRFKVNLITGTAFAIALLLLGIDFPFLWGFLTVFLSFIPYLGIVMAGASPTLLAFAENGIGGAITVILTITIINVFAENVLDPMIQGKGNKISTAAVVISLIFWTWLFGVLGAVLAMPLTVLIKMIFEQYKETHWIASLMEGYYEPPKGTKKNPSWFKKTQGSLSRMLPHRNGSK